MRLVSACLPFLCAAVAVGAGSAEDAPFTFPRSTPEAQGVSSAALLDLVETAGQKIDALHSIMVVRHGKVIAEGWWSPYAAGEPHMMYSLSKSFTSTAVGLAVADGKLSIDDPVLKFFPDESPKEPGANLRAMRISDLLTMSSGQHEEDIRAFPYNSEESVVRKFLSLPVAHKPGTHFVYNTPASYMLSAIVQKVTGQPVLEYLGPRLFEPLGIRNPTWEASRQGVSMGGFGLSVRTEDIARFGELYLRKGMWKGKQLVSAEWVDSATSRQVSNGSSPTSDWEQGYGFQFWRSRHGFYRGDGAHGQFCLILPQYDTVVAITSGTRDMGSVMNLVWDRLVPALKPEALPADQVAQRKLAATLAGLTLPAQAGNMISARAGSIAGKRFEMDSNPHSIEAITLDSAGADGKVSVTFRMAGADYKFAAAHGAWQKGELRVQDKVEPIAASGAWTADDAYTLRIVRYRTPFTTTYKMRFDGESMAVEAENNVGAAETRILRFNGKLRAGL
jgi:CubicO group peptidase (beta-lactamase class C family)